MDSRFRGPGRLLPEATQEIECLGITIVLEWMPGSRSCLHSDVTAPAPLSTCVSDLTLWHRAHLSTNAPVAAARSLSLANSAITSTLLSLKGGSLCGLATTRRHSCVWIAGFWVIDRK